MATNETVMEAVRRKCNVSWDDGTTSARLEDVVATVSPRLSSLLGYPSDHEFTPADHAFGSLFLNACLYEFSDALDDFEGNYAGVIHSERLLVVAAGGGSDAQAEG